MNEPLIHWYSFDSTKPELSNENQYDMVWIVFKHICIFVPWKKVVSALKGLRVVQIFGLHQSFGIRTAINSRKY